MNARKIRAGHRSVRGYFPSVKNGRQIAFESTFERDYFYLLEFDGSVLSYLEQPMQVEIKWNGEHWNYTPDVLVERNNANPHLIVEVKPSINDFPEQKKKAMEAWCKEHSSEFKVVGAKNIRTPELDRAKFLYPYHRTIPTAEITKNIIAEFSQLDSIPLRHFLNRKNFRAAHIYHLIATGSLECQDIPSMNSNVTYHGNKT